MAHKHVWIEVTTVSDEGVVRQCFECGLEQIRKFGTSRWINRDRPKVLPLATDKHLS